MRARTSMSPCGWNSSESGEAKTLTARQASQCSCSTPCQPGRLAAAVRRCHCSSTRLYQCGCTRPYQWPSPASATASGCASLRCGCHDGRQCACSRRSGRLFQLHCQPGRRSRRQRTRLCQCSSTRLCQCSSTRLCHPVKNLGVIGHFAVHYGSDRPARERLGQIPPHGRVPRGGAGGLGARLARGVVALRRWLPPRFSSL